MSTTLIVLGGIGLGLLGRRLGRIWRSHRAIADAARQVGLDAVPLDGERSSPDYFTGVWAGREVSLRRITGGVTRDLRLRLTVRGLLPQVSARPLGGHRRVRTSDEYVLRDPSFDQQVAVRETDHVTMLRLHRRVRGGLPTLFERGWTLQDGDAQLELRWDGGRKLDLAPWRASIEAFAAVSDGGPSTVASWLDDEPKDAVRYRMLVTLAALGPKAVRARLPARIRHDPSPPLAALATALVGDREAWRALPEGLRKEVERLAPHHVVGLYSAPSDEVELLRMATQAWGATAVLALEALGERGSREVVMPLRELAGRSGVSREISQRALQAINAIQSRISGAERGQIAVLEAPVEAGGLTVAGEDGALSVAEGGGLSVAQRAARGGGREPQGS